MSRNSSFFLTEEEVRRGIGKLELDALRKHYKQEKGYNVIELYECGRWKLYKIYIIIEQHLREFFLQKMPLREGRLLENTKPRSPFGYV